MPILFFTQDDEDDEDIVDSCIQINFDKNNQEECETLFENPSVQSQFLPIDESQIIDGMF